MTSAATSTPPADTQAPSQFLDASSGLDTVMSEARKVLGLCFPGSRILLYVLQSEIERCIEWRAERDAFVDCVSDQRLVRIVEFDAAVTPGDPVEHPYICARVTVSLSTRPYTPPGWRPRSPLRSLVFHFAPLLFEQLKFFYEEFQSRTSGQAFWSDPLRRAKPAIQSMSFRQSGIEDARPTIIIAMYWLNTGGAETFAKECIRLAVSLGFQAVVLCDWPGSGEISQSPFDFPAVEIIRADLFCDQELYYRLVLGLMSTRNIVGIHIHHSGKMYNTLPHVHRRAERPTVIDTTHIVEFKDGGFARISGVLTDFIDHHHVISRTLRSYYQKFFSRVNDVHLGFLIKDHDAGMAVEDFSILQDKNEYVVGFVGRVTHQKRPFLFMEIARRITRSLVGRDLKVRFLFVGGGPYLDATTRSAEKLKPAIDVEMLGHRTDAFKVMQQMDVLLITSANEGLTLVAYEALDAGTLVLSADVGAQKELIPQKALIDPSPYKFCRHATQNILRLLRDKKYARELICESVENSRKLRNHPSAEQVITGLYSSLSRSRTS